MFVQRRPNVFDGGSTLHKMLYKCFVFAGAALVAFVLTMNEVAAEVAIYLSDRVFFTRLQQHLCHLVTHLIVSL